MSDAEDRLTIEKILTELKNSYIGVDLRVVLARPRESDHDQWISVFLKMVFTNKEQADVRRSQEETQGRVGLEDEENLKVKLVYVGMNEAYGIINCISRGHISISGYLANIFGDYDQIKNREAVNSSFADSQYLCKMVWSSMNSGSVVPLLENTVGKRKVDLKKISQLLNIENLQTVIGNNVILLFPLYSKRLDVQNDDKGKILCKYEIDKSLVEKCEVRLAIRNQEGERQYRRALNEYIDSVQGMMATISIPLPTDLRLLHSSDVNVELWHSEIGHIRHPDSFGASEIMKLPYSVEFLMEAFKPFTAYEHFSEFLLNPATDIEQTTGVSWLLNLLDFRTIDLGRMKGRSKLNLEAIKASSRQDSCDFLVVHGSDKVIAMDCTITIPRPDKIQKIRNTADAITESLKKNSTDIQIIPAIISSANCGGLDTTQDHVRLLDRNDLSKILDLVAKGLLDDAVIIVNKKIA